MYTHMQQKREEATHGGTAEASDTGPVPPLACWAIGRRRAWTQHGAVSASLLRKHLYVANFEVHACMLVVVARVLARDYGGTG